MATNDQSQPQQEQLIKGGNESPEQNQPSPSDAAAAEREQLKTPAGSATGGPVAAFCGLFSLFPWCLNQTFGRLVKCIISAVVSVIEQAMGCALSGMTGSDSGPSELFPWYIRIPIMLFFKVVTMFFTVEAPQKEKVECWLTSSRSQLKDLQTSVVHKIRLQPRSKKEKTEEAETGRAEKVDGKQGKSEEEKIQAKDEQRPATTGKAERTDDFLTAERLGSSMTVSRRSTVKKSSMP